MTEDVQDICACLRRQAATRHLADHKLPEEFHYLATLPKNPVGRSSAIDGTGSNPAAARG
jgi:non-ribosomal peptide synthetase component E (peptide arylation enzyme)